MIEVVNDDVINWAQTYEGPKFHGLLTDPPYHLTSITKRFSGGIKAKYGTDGAFQRASKGFLGKEWDGGELAFQAETWALFKELLYPGAYGMAFASSRGWHRMATAIEDAGFVIHPSIFLWTYATGMPKATRIKDERFYETHRYGAGTLKPAAEPIIVFQRPYGNRPLSDIIETGAGAINVEAARIPDPNGELKSGEYKRTHEQSIYNEGTSGYTSSFVYDGSRGRWPSNLIVMHTPQCTDERCSEECIVSNDTRFFQAVDYKIEQSEGIFSVAKPSRSERNNGLETNMHPTVKPVRLSQYLSALIRPPEDYLARLLVTFSGTGSEAMGALLSGWNEIVCVEKDEEYANFSIRRISQFMKEHDL